jgi:hypothetical protein
VLIRGQKVVVDERESPESAGKTGFSDKKDGSNCGSMA